MSLGVFGVKCVSLGVFGVECVSLGVGVTCFLFPLQVNGFEALILDILNAISIQSQRSCHSDSDSKY